MPDSHLKDKTDMFSFLLYSKCLYFSKVNLIFMEIHTFKNINLSCFVVNDVTLRNLTLKIFKINFFTLFPELDIQYSIEYFSLTNPKMS